MARSFRAEGTVTRSPSSSRRYLAFAVVAAAAAAAATVSDALSSCPSLLTADAFVLPTTHTRSGTHTRRRHCQSQHRHHHQYHHHDALSVVNLPIHSLRRNIDDDGSFEADADPNGDGDEDCGSSPPLTSNRVSRLSFKRDILSRVGFSSISSHSFSSHSSSSLSSSRRTSRAPSRRRSTTALRAWYNKNKGGGGGADEGGDANSNNKKNRISKNNLVNWKSKKDNNADENDAPDILGLRSLGMKVDQVKDTVAQKVTEVVPQPLLDALSTLAEKVSTFWPNVKLAVLSFVAGGVLMLTAILVPVYSSIETLSEPVTLFETILADLDAGYVDPVDTNKLFETGVSAMLRSLDPYTEFEAREEAQQLTEGIMGKYGGVGLVIAGVTPRDIAEMRKVTGTPAPASSTTIDQPTGSKLLPQDAIEDSMMDEDGGSDLSSKANDDGGVRYVEMTKDDVDDFDPDDEEERMVRKNREDQLRALSKAQAKGIRVVSAFEGYAFDYGMRVGDKLYQVDDLVITKDTSVEDVRNVLRGEPGTMVTIKFEREGVKGVQEITMPRTIVQLRDVKLATLVGKPSDGIGYISLGGFAASAGSEVRGAILALEQAAEEASNGAHSLKGLILDLRGNPGGLLTSAVDVASLLVPKDSDIVSAKGRGFPGVIYRSRVEPLLDPSTKLAVLVNRGTASAAEIVSGAVQDLDAGIIIVSGGDRNDVSSVLM